MVGTEMSGSNLASTDKLRASLFYILTQGGSMEIMRLAKLLYLSDYLFAKTFGNKHGFMGIHKRFEFGPVPSAFYNVYDQLEADRIVVKQVNTVSLLVPQTIDGLSEQELACVDKTIERFRGLSLNQVKRAAYETEPMKSIQNREASMGASKLMYESMDFDLIKIHPLFDDSGLNLDFLNDPEYLKSRE